MAWGLISLGGPANANGYTLPTATKHVLGGVKTGDGIENTGGTISPTFRSRGKPDDLNDATAPGWYGYQAGTANAPAGDAGIVLVASADGYVWPMQMAFPTLGNVIFVRVYNGSSWSAWASINSWRGIQNNLSSDSTTDSLSAAMGKALKELMDGKAASGHGHDAATQWSAGFMSAADKAKLDGIADGANNYTLPAATGYLLGGVKVGMNLSIAQDGTLYLSAENILGALAADQTFLRSTSSAYVNGLLVQDNALIYSRGDGSAGSFQLEPIATSLQAGIVKIGANLSWSPDGTIGISADNVSAALGYRTVDLLTKLAKIDSIAYPDGKLVYTVGWNTTTALSVSLPNVSYVKVSVDSTGGSCKVARGASGQVLYYDPPEYLPITFAADGTLTVAAGNQSWGKRIAYNVEGYQYI